MEYEYIAYIDEAGDPGLNKVRPIDEKGATEWMNISCVLVRKPNFGKEAVWLNDTLKDIGVHQRTDLHFRDLSPTRKRRVCGILASLPVRCFVVSSNKKNMRQYNNSRAAKAGSKQWFYNWIARILIERVTHYVEGHSIKNYGEPKKIKFVFSQRGGHSYNQTESYHSLLAAQSISDTAFLRKWVPKWSVMGPKLVEAVPHKERAGLQFSDVVASAFYTAVDNLDTGPCDGTYAKLLEPRMAFRGNYRHSDYGVVLQPTPDWSAKISEDQRDIFRHYGYGFIPNR